MRSEASPRAALEAKEYGAVAALGGVTGGASGNAVGLVTVTERGDDDEVSGLGQREDAFEGMLKEATAGERHERLRFGVPEPGAAAGGDDDDGEGGRAHATERIRHRC